MNFAIVKVGIRWRASTADAGDGAASMVGMDELILACPNISSDHEQSSGGARGPCTLFYQGAHGGRKWGTATAYLGETLLLPAIFVSYKWISGFVTMEMSCRHACQRVASSICP